MRALVGGDVENLEAANNTKTIDGITFDSR